MVAVADASGALCHIPCLLLPWDFMRWREGQICMSQTPDAWKASLFKNVPLTCLHSVPGPENTAGPPEGAAQEPREVETPEITLNKWCIATSFSSFRRRIMEVPIEEAPCSSQ